MILMTAKEGVGDRHYMDVEYDVCQRLFELKAAYTETIDTGIRPIFYLLVFGILIFQIRQY